MNAAAPEPAAIARAVQVLRAGGLVAMPTETVYGLAADAGNANAVRSIFAAKGRPADHPLIVHVADAQALAYWTATVPASALALSRAFWPGPLTLVLARAPGVDTVVTGGQDTIGLRCPAHPWAHALLAACAQAGIKGLAAPSANSFGRISPTTADHVRADLGEKPAGGVDLILDGGACAVGIESTIVDCSGAGPRLLRHGVIGRAQLEAVLGAPVPDAGADAPRASGRLRSHYAPRTPLELLSATELPARINALRAERLAVLAPAAVLLDAPAHVLRRVIAPASPAEYARRLYAALHELDRAGADRILVARVPETPDWAAVADRLERAAAR
jgi:L-threonylcarbamoyladenylate synthase